MNTTTSTPPPTERRRQRPPHPDEPQIRALLHAGLNNATIVRRLHVPRSAVRRLREETGIPTPPRQPLTLEQKWAQYTRPVAGGHLEWLGSRLSSGTPTMRYLGRSYSPTAIAFRQHTGRDAVGQVRSECPYPHCVAPGHGEDEPGRRRLREQLRFLNGVAPRPAVCRYGHDQAVDGRCEPDGTAYCKACKREQKQARRTAGAAEPRAHGANQ